MSLSPAMLKYLKMTDIRYRFQRMVRTLFYGKVKKC